MDLNELFKDVTSFNKEAAMKENMRMVELKDSVTAQAFRDAHIKLASYVNVLKIDSPESNLTEFSRNKLSGKMKAMLSVSTTAGLKRLPIHFVVKASVPSMVETPEQVVAALENVEGSIDKEVKEILEKQKQMSAYHNEDIEVKADGEKIPAVQYRDMHTAIHHLALFNTRDEALEAFERLKQIQHTEYPEGEEGVEGYNLDMYEAFTTCTDDIEVDYRTVQDDPKYDIVNKDFVIDASSKKSNIKVEAKKKEIDLGVRENSSASQFPVKLLVYPKTYLPELKKGDILNVGGFKYRYIGDEPTISGDTENGINARFELVVSTKKASLNVTAADGDDKKEEEKLSPEEKKRREEIARETKEALESKKYLKGLSKEEVEDMDDDMLRVSALNCLDYNVVMPKTLVDELANRPKVAAEYLSNPELSLFRLDEEPKKLTDIIENNSSFAYDVLIGHKDELDKIKSINDLPEILRKPLLSDVSVAVKIAKKYPSLLTQEMANFIVENSPSDAIDLGVQGWNKSIKNEAFKTFVDFAEKQGIDDKDIKTVEELGLTGVEGYEPSDKELSDTEQEDNKSNKPLSKEISDFEKKQKEYFKDKSQEQVDFSGTGVNVNKGPEVEDEENEPQSSSDNDDEERLQRETKEFDKEQKEREEERKNVEEGNKEDGSKKKSEREVETKIEKEADGDLTFAESVSNDNVSDEHLEKKELIAMLKEQNPQFKNIPDEWFDVVEVEDYSGTINWALNLDPKDWGIETFSISILPSKVYANLRVKYFENAEAADLGNTSDENVDVLFDLNNAEAEVNTSIGAGNSLMAQKVDLWDRNTATVYF